MAIETVPFDPSTYLRSPEAQAELLTDAFSTGDAAYVSAALATVARAKAADGMPDADRSEPGSSGAADPSLSSVLDLMRTLGLRLQVEPERA